MAKSSVKLINKPSVLLNREENNSIFGLLSRGETSLATGVIQLLITSPPRHTEWQLFGTGVICFVKNNQKRSYYFRLYDFDQKNPIWEQEIYLHINYLQPDPLFHMFEADNCLAAFNFADQTDSLNFRNVVKEKADFIIRMLTTEERPKERPKDKPKGKPKEKPQQNLTNNSLKVPNVSPVRARSLDSLQTNYKNSNSKTKSKQKISKLEIGSPTNFRHIQHIGWNPETGFDFNVSDPKLHSFFEMAGVSADLLDDVDTRKFIFDFIDTHGGIQTAIQEVAESKKVPKFLAIYSSTLKLVYSERVAQPKAETISRIYCIPTQSTMDSVFGAEHSVHYKLGFIISGFTTNGLGMY